MQENAAKIRVKTGNSGTFTGKIEKNQKIFRRSVQLFVVVKFFFIWYKGV